jgi:hypothetical protein
MGAMGDLFIEHAENMPSSMSWEEACEQVSKYTSKFIQFQLEKGKTFTLDTWKSHPPSHMVEKNVVYEKVFPFIKMVVQEYSERFFLVLTEEEGWVEVDNEMGEGIIGMVEME